MSTLSRVARTTRASLPRLFFTASILAPKIDGICCFASLLLVNDLFYHASEGIRYSVARQGTRLVELHFVLFGQLLPLVKADLSLIRQIGLRGNQYCVNA